ncbi:ADP-dependent NAD(P)H-hydrate dehydratase [Gleimia hominis]|uniref:ADP-dependent NAD(P)H-hydrate dehydratase n=1 Tax=Gleimia hominis TaxID=595468 RepID=UPI0013041930|nr:ADP/ATP-dependent (S)-NAD(P)H-hydrate dehydratase [Gleimia hominis]WIK64613.1 NAD(P)H-hydrate dehydratase [Gleimia hominis]
MDSASAHRRVEAAADANATVGANSAGEVNAAVGANSASESPGSSCASRAQAPSRVGCAQVPNRTSCAQAFSRPDFARAYRIPDARDHKYTRGVVGLVVGSDKYPGAAVMATAGALRTGVGMVRYQGPELPARLVLNHFPSAVVGDGHVQAHVVGSGIDDDEFDTRVRPLLNETGEVLVVDASALPGYTKFVAQEGGRDQRADVPTVLTPNVTEAVRMMSELSQQDTSWNQVHEALADCAAKLADLTGATVAVKGADTAVCSPGQTPLVVTGACAWVGTAGSGDVLAGAIGARVAAWQADRENGRAVESFDRAVASGVWIVAAAGRAAAEVERFAWGHPVEPMEVADAIPRAIAQQLEE